MAARMGRAFGVALFLLSTGLLLRLSSTSAFATDEFTYAHAAWTIAHGQQPFRDFFFHHFPLSVQLGSLLMGSATDPGAAMRAMRTLMVPCWVGILLLASHANRARGLWAAALTAPVLGSLWTWDFATQFRPDPLAIALFLSSVMLATQRTSERSAARTCGLLGGVCFVLAVWASQKVVIYGVALPLAWACSAYQARTRPLEPRAVPEPLWLMLGVLLGCIPIACYLAATRNWQPFYAWCWQWGLMHEAHYPARPKLNSLQETLSYGTHLLVLGAVGLGATLTRLVRHGRAALAERDALWALSGFTTAASYFMQRAPYEWSLVAPLTFVGLFAARALGDAAGFFAAAQRARWQQVAGLAGCLIIACLELPFSARPQRITTDSRAHQERLFADVRAITAPTDVVYDNTGYYVTRPHAHFFYFSDKTLRVVESELLSREMPRAILDRGVTVHIAEKRDAELPAELARFLAGHFVRVVDSVRLWGKRFQGFRPGEERPFEAVRDAHYYVSPAAMAGSVRIDGLALQGSRIWLTAGTHTVRRTASRPAPDFALLWLPRDGRERPALPELRRDDKLARKCCLHPSCPTHLTDCTRAPRKPGRK